MSDKENSHVAVWGYYVFGFVLIIILFAEEPSIKDAIVFYLMNK